MPGEMLKSWRRGSANQAAMPCHSPTPSGPRSPGEAAVQGGIGRHFGLSRSLPIGFFNLAIESWNKFPDRVCRCVKGDAILRVQETRWGLDSSIFMWRPIGRGTVKEYTGSHLWNPMAMNTEQDEIESWLQLPELADYYSVPNKCTGTV